MHLLDDQVLGGRHQASSLVRLFAPKQVHNIVTSLVNLPDGLLGELLPALLLVAVALASSDGQDCIQQKHSLLRPEGEIPMHSLLRRHFEVDLGVVLKRFVDVDEARWDFDAPVHAEAHPHGLALLDVWVLANHHDLDVAESCLLEGVEDLMRRRVANVLLAHAVLRFDELVEHLEPWAAGVVGHWLFPSAK